MIIELLFSINPGRDGDEAVFFFNKIQLIISTEREMRPD